MTEINLDWSEVNLSISFERESVEKIHRNLS